MKPKATLLVIDDDATLTRALEIYLIRAEYQVHIANNGTEGLRGLYELRPDLVVLEKGALGSIDLLQLICKGHVPIIYPLFSFPLGMVDAILRREDGSYEGGADYTRGIDDTALGY